MQTAKAVGQNNIPFAGNTHVTSSNTLLDRDPSSFMGIKDQSEFALQTVGKPTLQPPEQSAS